MNNQNERIGKLHVLFDKYDYCTDTDNLLKNGKILNKYWYDQTLGETYWVNVIKKIKSNRDNNVFLYTGIESSIISKYEKERIKLTEEVEKLYGNNPTVKISEYPTLIKNYIHSSKTNKSFRLMSFYYVISINNISSLFYIPMRLEKTHK